jgi:hypothetical protein
MCVCVCVCVSQKFEKEFRRGHLRELNRVRESREGENGERGRGRVNERVSQIVPHPHSALVPHLSLFKSFYSLSLSLSTLYSLYSLLSLLSICL